MTSLYSEHFWKSRDPDILRYPLKHKSLYLGSASIQIKKDKENIALFILETTVHIWIHCVDHL